MGVAGDATAATPSRAGSRLNTGPVYARPVTGQRRITACVMRSFVPPRRRHSHVALSGTAPRWNRKRSDPLALLMSKVDRGDQCDGARAAALRVAGTGSPLGPRCAEAPRGRVRWSGRGAFVPYTSPAFPGVRKLTQFQWLRLAPRAPTAPGNDLLRRHSFIQLLTRGLARWSGRQDGGGLPRTALTRQAILASYVRQPVMPRERRFI